MSDPISIVKNSFSAWVKKTLDPQNIQGALVRGVYPLYQQFQTQRFQTENASEGSTWDPLDFKYAQYKLKRYGGGAKRATKKDPRTQWQSWPGGGSKTLIGTGTLAGAIVGPSQGNPFSSQGIGAHQALFTSTSMTININTSGLNAEGKKFVYPPFVNQKRPIMKFSTDHIQQMKSVLAQFMIGTKS